MAQTLYSKTPSVVVMDNRGLNVRTVQYYRHPDTVDFTDERISFSQYTLAGFPERIFSPRQYDLWKRDNSIKPDRASIQSLSGMALRTEGADDGVAAALNDIAGRPVISVDAMGVKRRYLYEENHLAGRLLSITEQAPDQEFSVVERFVWSGNGEQEKAYNLVGTCVSRYDTAGREECQSVSLLGSPLRITRQLLPDDIEADWQGNTPNDWNTLFSGNVSGNSFTTCMTADVTGALLIQTDAMGNQLRYEYDRAGQLKSHWLTSAQGKEKNIIASLTYSAAGQTLTQKDGNGILTTNLYEQKTQRLSESRVERPSDHPSGATILQNFHYKYDPVGNVVSVYDHAQAVRYWRNQKISPENQYTYDSFYQLVSATGREMSTLSGSISSLPSPLIPVSNGDDVYTNYIRRYTYDRGNNLTQIQHNAPGSRNNHATSLTVSSRNNRAVLSAFTTDPEQVDTWFDAGGHQTSLLPGQKLTYNQRGELSQVTPVSRDTEMDEEWYRYNEDSQRLVKVSQYLNGNTQRKARTVYLPGLELRTMFRGNTLNEELHIITAGHVRLLHWVSGQPAEIEGDQLRYSYSNFTGSSAMEVDEAGKVISQEEYYPYGGTSIWTVRNQTEAAYKFHRYSGKERDATGLYYYGLRYYQPWAGRWLSADPGGIIDGLNMFSMVHNNPVNGVDSDGGASLMSNVITLIGGIFNNGFSLPSFSRPSFSWPSFSLPSFSRPSFSFDFDFSFDFSPVGVVKKIAGPAIKFVYKKAYKKLLNYALSKAKTEQQKRNIIRGFRGVSVGVGVAVAIAGVVSSAGLAIPVAVGVVAAGGAIAGAVGVFAGPISRSLSKAYAKLFRGRTAAHLSTATGNFMAGGSAGSAAVAHGVTSVNDPVLKRQGRTGEYRSLAGAEVGIASGTVSAVLNDDLVKSGIAASAAAMGSQVSESQKALEGVGDVAATAAIEGASAGRKLAKALGLRSLTARAAETVAEVATNVDISPASLIENSSTAIYAHGKTFLHVRTGDTNNFEAFRNIEETLPADGDAGWLSGALENVWGWFSWSRNQNQESFA
ncbi:RHS repeat-associated core domain-containing protein [Xenorhabdus cabanillasii]|uniref:Insecticidal toxin complex protein TccC n=1 Tax=Xenorhabdus cabanillasii JM26 TaxID=1427517 RepID=W1IQG7_9GAMM|nr:RHS repeat-associated core domain-containing protein [Xenorhabdus cabanillasii]PHM76633.1 insecticidal toxin, SepC/Tcc class [Xenorhabdus cabanillasii JM26]CDL79876.1 Insecticidal toxin complex protein TccC [Xenorhabdus cabanillasii JM26]